MSLRDNLQSTLGPSYVIDRQGLARLTSEPRP